jgi:apolipoprotein N-acyltransferase
LSAIAASLRIPPRAALIGAFLAGAAAVAGFAPVGVFPLPIVALGALLLLWHVAANKRAAAFTGFAFGLGFFGVGVSWVYVSLHEFGAMPLPLAGAATLVFCVILALYPALVGWIFVRLRGAPCSDALLVLPSLWAISEWLRGWIFTGFPWLSIGYSQTDTPLAALAPVLGVFGVSWMCAFLSGLLFLLIVEGRRARVASAIGIVIALAVCWTLSRVAWTSPVGAPLRVALLQGNIPQDMKFTAERYEATLATYRKLIAASQAQLIVLPETAIPRFFDAVDPHYWGDIDDIARTRGADLLVGVPFRDGRNYYNSVVSLGMDRPQLYNKTHLVPFGEFVPTGFRWIVDTMTIPLGDFTRGAPDQRPLALAGQRVAPNVCYEDAFGEEIIRQLPEATLLVNVSNVAWFGDSLAPAQHAQMSRMRARETGRYMLRATNTGITAIIDERGNVVSALPQFTEGALQGEARGFSGATPYVRGGNVLIVALCFVVLGFAAWRARRGVGRAAESR